MKKLMFSLIAFSLFLASCNKEETQGTIEEGITTSEDLATLQNLTQDTEDEVDFYVDAVNTNTLVTDECPLITVSPDDGSFPRTITIDYGTDGCEGPRGRTRKGQIIIEQTDSLRLEGAERTVTLQNFSIDEVAIEGTKYWTNNGFDASGNISISREVSTSITYPNGDQASWEANHLLTQTAGGDTQAWMDNVYEISGGSSGTNRNGVAFSVSITQPLVKSKNCPWIQSGIKEFSFGDRNRTLDYGDGSCDNQAVVTYNNGQTRTIRIRAWWR
ncbi:MAG: hypothetical protein MRY78_06705 [Saprospiraceae bacterium]|nr:hypothetical protein [Saprospiraceae bacterium]